MEYDSVISYDNRTPYQQGYDSALIHLDEMLSEVIIETYAQARHTNQVHVRDLIARIKAKYGIRQ